MLLDLKCGLVTYIHIHLRTYIHIYVYYLLRRIKSRKATKKKGGEGARVGKTEIAMKIDKGKMYLVGRLCVCV